MTDENAKTLKFHYIKSPMCRDLHINGVFGGMHPQTGDLHMSVFSERPAIPQAITFGLQGDGSLGSEQNREGREGMVRIIQDTMYMDFNAAIAMHQWLSGHIERFLESHPEIAVKAEEK